MQGRSICSMASAIATAFTCPGSCARLASNSQFPLFAVYRGPHHPRVDADGCAWARSARMSRDCCRASKAPSCICVAREAKFQPFNDKPISAGAAMKDMRWDLSVVEDFQ